MLNADEVQKYGTDDLVLFKCDDYERNESLNGRVSMSIDPDSLTLIIREGGRGTLRLEQGDIIMTRRGELVAIVPHKSERIADGTYGVRVPLIKDVEKFWDESVTVLLKKGPKDKYYIEFANSMKQIREVYIDREGKIPVKK